MIVGGLIYTNKRQQSQENAEESKVPLLQSPSNAPVLYSGWLFQGLPFGDPVVNTTGYSNIEVED